MATLEVQRATALPRGRQLLSRRLFLWGLAGALAPVAPGRAGADTVRQLTLVRPATGESARKVPFWCAGAPYEQGLAELGWVLRDVDVEQVYPIDVRVYYLLGLLQAALSEQPIIVTTGYRTKANNERLRQQGIDAARNSFLDWIAHRLGPG
jgi:uncharacterized protein YcbK (DUF882 family)